MNTMVLSSTGQHWTASPGFADETRSKSSVCWSDKMPNNLIPRFDLFYQDGSGVLVAEIKESAEVDALG